ncbi:hypothetical protein L7F22_058327 [Adiantum nelumboides]|nr:hypothetical protein [Adiantum nelumboides]
MPSVSVKLYSVFFKTLLKHKLLHTPQTSKDGCQPVLGQSSRVPANASFVDGVATKDINLDPTLTLRIFLPESALPQESDTLGNTGLFGCIIKEAKDLEHKGNVDRRASLHDGSKKGFRLSEYRRNSWGGERVRQFLADKEDAKFILCKSCPEEENQHVQASLDEVLLDPQGANPCDAPDDRGNYQGYTPDFTDGKNKQLPIIIQFHGGGFVTGSKDSASNDCFCRRMAKLCDAIVIAVGYRLAPEHKYPAAFNDGFDALSWIATQANLAECNRSLGKSAGNVDAHQKSDKELIAAFGGSTIVEPWIAAHGDPSRCVLLGVSSGGNIADFVARKAVQEGRLLEPLKIVAQVLMYPFFVGSVPTQSEIKLANSYFYDKATCILAWKLFFPDGKFSVDHPIANPLVPGREPPLKHLPPTLTVVGELDWMKDRAIAYSEALRKASLDAPVLEYKDAVHEFATLDFLVKSRQAESCAEDITIWIKKYVSQKGHEFSY